MHDEKHARLAFLALWTVVTAIKLVVAARLPLFVDEAFYWQEGRHLALAYSDLPGLNAWLARLGTELGGQHVLALRAPFLLMAALMPWLAVRIGARWFGQAAGWQAGCLVLLMPLSATLGLLALPDVPMALATLLCIDAAGRLLHKVDGTAAATLALGLVIGALSHYRFIGVIGMGCIALLLLPQGRRALMDWRVWLALAVGAAAWAPLLAWNLANADAGLRFQMVDRHPWSFQWTGAWFVLVQALLVTPLLFAAMGVAVRDAWRGRNAGATDSPGSTYPEPAQAACFALLGAISTLGFFWLGFFADVERVSFHWPLPGYLALLLLVPAVLGRWRAGWRRATWLVTVAGLCAVLGWYLVVSVPAWRAQLAAYKFYPSNFAGWDELEAAVREELAAMPVGTQLLADSFKSGAELGFALDDPRIEVLDHPLNHRHGRAPQLRLWGLQGDGSRDGPRLLVVGASEVRYRELLDYYQQLCAEVGPLPAPRVVNVDHGRQRFLLFRLPAERASGPCTTPAFAWIDAPLEGAAVGARFTVEGWAFKDGVGIERVEVLLDGQVVGQASYGLPSPGTAEYWEVSIDPNHPDVGFTAEIDATGQATGLRWLGLRLHGADGSVEDWPEQPLRLR